MKKNQYEKQPNPSIVIEVATPADTPGILHVQKETWLNTYPNEEYGITREDILLKNFESQERIATRNERIAKYSRDNTGQMWVAKEGSEVVGFAEVALGDDKNTLGALYVIPSSQGQDIGGKLMKTLLVWLGNDKDIVLNVVAYNKTKQFYEKYGFKETELVEEDPAGSFPNGKQMPEVEMVRPKSQ